MSFVLFITVIVLLVLLVTKKSTGSSDDRYAQGYWDGYRALGDKLQPLLRREHIDKGSLQKEIDVGFVNSESPHAEYAPSEVPAAMPQSVDQTYPTTIIADDRAIKEQQSLTNMNILLFVASLLFVAAGAAFVAAAMPDEIKLVGVWLLTAAFYGVGMWLRSTTKLKAAGTAFIGTSLGLIPFAGIALHELANMPTPVAWCITSLVGLFAYFFAALRLQSAVVSYLTLAFVVSLASSFAESLSVPIMWNFVLIIGASLLANVVAYIKPTWVPKIFSEPIERTGQLVTPLALAASLALADQLSLRAYEVVFGVATLHYAVVWLQSRQRAYETVVRVLLHITLFIIAIDIFDSETITLGLVFLGLATLQQVYSLIRFRNDKPGQIYEWFWIHIMQFFQFVSPLFWLTADNNSELTTVAFSLLGLSSLAITLRSRRAISAVPGLAISLILPFIVMRELIEPALDWSAVAAWFAIVTSLVLAGWRWMSRRSNSVKAFLVGAFWSYAAMTAAVGCAVETDWGRLIIFMVLAGLLWRGSFAMSQVIMSVFGSLAFVIAVIQAWNFLELSQTWLALGVAWFASLVLYLGYLLLVEYKDEKRALGLLGVMWATLAIAAAVSYIDNDTNLAAALTIVVGAGTLAIEAWRQKNKQLIETAVYIATFGLQLAVGITWPDLNIVFYAHWWALTAALLALWRTQLTTRLIIGMSLITVSTGIYALAEGEFYQLLFLAEHIGLLVVGVLKSKQWAIWWGLIASVLAVLYFLRDIAFLAFAFLGMVVIGIVIWRLTKVGREHPEQ